MWRDKPRHYWASHGADAFLVAVEAVEATGGGGSPLADGATEAADSSLSSVFATTYRATPGQLGDVARYAPRLIASQRLGGSSIARNPALQQMHHQDVRA